MTDENARNNSRTRASRSAPALAGFSSPRRPAGSAGRAGNGSAPLSQSWRYLWASSGGVPPHRPERTRRLAQSAPAAPGAEPGATPSGAASRGALPLEGVSALDFKLGDCFQDFDPEAAQSTVVDCGSGHSAQLVAVETYSEPGDYPGRDPLKQKALDACKAAELAEKSADYSLGYKLAYPSSTSWDKGDRRVDCYIIAETGNVIMESLLP